MLHIINKSPFEKNTFTSAIKHAQKGSTFLLIEDGVYAALANSSFSNSLKTAINLGKVVVLSNDVQARGIQEKLNEAVEQTDYAGFVDLVTDSTVVHSWL